MNKYNRYKIVMTNGKEYVVRYEGDIDSICNKVYGYPYVVLDHEISPYVTQVAINTKHISTIHPLPEE